MAARVAAGLAPWTRMAGFIANRLKKLISTMQGYCYLKPRAIVLLVAGLCALTGAGAIGLDSKGDKPYKSMGPLPALVQLPALVSPLPKIADSALFATSAPPPSTPFLPSSLSQGSASASPSTPPIQGPEAASKAAGCSASPNYPAVCASSSLPPPAPQSVHPGSAFHCCLGSVHLESHDAEHQSRAQS
ncbi:hypothetical protein QJQ45_014186 [Haematococcus lacustris]|nr:hypothetical protein QJQ45_014186 [Haematococcus lacustris]